MRIHHLSCGTMCPWGGRLMDGPDRGPGPAELVCHCLLIETDGNGLVLVDTGFGLGDINEPVPRLSRTFIGLNRPQFVEENTAIRQIERLGFRASDVRHILVTHLDFDHAGGIEDFSDAAVHVFAAELSAARARRGGLTGRARYRPMQWDSDVKFRTYGESGEAWYGFPSVRDLAGLPPDILMVPLIGHTWGHCGVAVRGPEGWLLHAGDAYFFSLEMDARLPRCTPGLRFYQWLMEVDRNARLENQSRLRALIRERGPEITIFCAHDRTELHRMQRRASASGLDRPPTLRKAHGTEAVSPPH
ncbi:MAG TPA: MBL fold metallo-hydrolase [Alphaproteobacteria bacterium]|nr:MBL fold metallo-hydrolase [Alphaproteobacteria bacterium]